MSCLSSECPNVTSEIDVVPSPKTYHTSKFAILCLTCFYPTCLGSIVMIEERVQQLQIFTLYLIYVMYGGNEEKIKYAKTPTESLDVYDYMCLVNSYLNYLFIL